MRTFTGRRVRSGSGCGNNETKVHRGNQRRRIRRERALAARRRCSSGTHFKHPSGYLGVIIAAFEARGRKDLAPEESMSWERHAEEHPLHCCGHFRSSRSFSSHRMAQGALAQAVSAWRSTRRPCGETSHPSQAARTGEKRPKGDRVVIFMILASKWGGPCFGLLSSSQERERVHGICQRGDRRSSFLSRLKAASDPDACQPAPSCAL